MKLNKSQTKAVLFGAGPCLTIAGPGSGKTAVITNRVHYLTEKHGVKPSNILVVTFTKAAATEMKNRYLRMANVSSSAVTFSTFHSLFFAILKYAYHFNASNILKEDVKYQYMREIIYRFRLEYDNEADFIGDLFSEISIVKNNEIAIENYYAKCAPEQSFRDIFKAYEEKIHSQRLIDFDDMLIYTKDLFVQRPDILAGWQKKFQYIMVDEFQDINKLQYDIIKLLAGDAGNLFAVGDDDQSIYHFRGASPQISFQFLKDFENAETIALDVNYRSTSQIVQLSQQLIGHNQKRFPKEIRPEQGDGKPVVFRVYKNQYEEVKAVLKEIERYIKAGGNYAEIAVLFRTNQQTGLFAEKFMEYNVPYRIKEHIPNLYEHWIAKDIFTYIRIALGSRQRKDFYQIMNRPNRYFSRDSLDDVTVAFDVWMDFYEEQDWMQERIDRLQYDFKMLAKMGPFAAMNYIRNGIGYEEYVKEYAQSRGIEREELIDLLDRLSESAKEYKTYEEWFEHIEEYKQELEEKTKRKQQQTEGNCVTLATLHAAKGLEYELVFLPELNEGIMPYKKAVLDSEIEEERRLLYVGMTRAKKELHLSAVQNLLHHEADVSPFMKEIGFLK